MALTYGDHIGDLTELLWAADAFRRAVSDLAATAHSLALAVSTHYVHGAGPVTSTTGAASQWPTEVHREAIAAHQALSALSRHLDKTRFSPTADALLGLIEYVRRAHDAAKR